MEPIFDEKDIKNLFGPPIVPPLDFEHTTPPPKPEEMIEVEFEPDEGEPAKLPPISSRTKALPNEPKHYAAIKPIPSPSPSPPPPRAPMTSSRSDDFWANRAAITPPSGAIAHIQTSFAGFKEPKTSQFFQSAAKFIGIFLLIFIISFTIINSQALILKIRYTWANNYNQSSWSTNAAIPVPVMTESRMLVPKIKVNAPIIWNIPSDQIIKNLQNGVVHYQGTALPGASGNIFITGHSSYYIWAPGAYKDVFALLNELDAGDKIYIQYQGVTFAYEVIDSKVVYPSDLSVLSSSSEKTLSLMTCVPVGTNLQRLIVTAKQVAN